MSSIYLRVKIKSLASEARDIRHEEAIQRRTQEWAKPSKRVEVEPGVWKRPAPRDLAIHDEARRLRLSLRDHRRIDVRNESRAALLAYGFLKGTPYAAMEATCINPPDWKRVRQLVEKYGSETPKLELLEAFLKWQADEEQAIQKAA